MSAIVRVLRAVVLLAAVFDAPLAAQDDQQASVTIPLRSVVTPLSAGESLELSGTLTVGSYITTAEDGTRFVSYTFMSQGTAVGQISKATYDISGTGGDRVSLDVELPADRGFSASFTAIAADKRHRFGVLLRATLDAEGRLTAATVTEIVSQP